MKQVAPNSKSMRQMVRVLGKLDALQHSKHRFTLLMDDGQKARCVWVDGDITPLSSLFGKRVLINGMGVWDARGKLDRIEVDRIRCGENEPDVWKWLPRPRFPSELPLEEPTPRPFGLEAMIGKWPGDETDEQIAEALKRIS